MIKVVLLDLDDTLITSNTLPLFYAYVRLLGEYAAHVAQPETFIKQVMTAYSQALDAYDPIHSLHERFMRCFANSMRLPQDSLEALFEDFYTESYPNLRSFVKPRAATPGLLDWLYTHDYRVVVATNPAMPESAILQRMSWGNIPADEYPFELITTLEAMHFGKPQPEYYEEVLARLDVEACEAIMVGDDWEGDIVGAAAVGMNTFWIVDDSTQPPDVMPPINGYTSYDRFVEMARSGWLETQEAHKPVEQAQIHRLVTFPAAIDALRRGYTREVLECCPGEKEWSVRDIICHLRDHEVEEDRPRFHRIVNEDNPFLSANYDPWAHAHEYISTSTIEALEEFVRYRAETVAWLREQPDDVWDRPARYAIFGPTTFGEMVKFTTEHDRTHLRQMHSAINFALTVCGPDADSG